MVENQEPPKNTENKPEQKEVSPYVSPRLRAKMEDKYDDEEEKAGPGAAIAVIGLAAVILVCGGLFLMSQKKAKKEPTGQTAEASQAPAPLDSAAVADLIARLAVADSLARAKSQQLMGNKPQPAKPAPAGGVSSKPAGTAGGAAARGAATGGAATGGAATGGAAQAAPAAPAKYGIAVGSFLFDDKAASEKDRLAGATSLEAVVIPHSDGGTTTYEVVIGSFDSRAAAESKGNELLSAGTVKESRVVKLKK